MQPAVAVAVAVVAFTAVLGEGTVKDNTLSVDSLSGAAPQCGVLAATRVAEAFVVSANRGSRAAIQRFVGAEFVAYSLREGEGATARFVRYGPRTVVDYLRTRQRQGERFSLLVVEVNERFGRSRAGVSFVIERTAPDLRRRGIRQPLVLVGKAELLCEPRRIIVWNLAMPRTAPNESCGLISCPCPTRRGWDRRTEIVACVTGSDRVRVVPRHASS